MNTPRNSPAAFSLIEVTLALGIAAFCLLTVFGLLPLGLNSTQNAAEQTTVAGIATAISSDLHGTPVITSSTGAATSQFNFPLPSPGGATGSIPVMHTLYFNGDGSPVLVNDKPGVDSDAPSTARYRATVRIGPDPTLYKVAPGNATTLYKVWILITWPALADPNWQTFPQNYAGSFETVTALNLHP